MASIWHLHVSLSKITWTCFRSLTRECSPFNIYRSSIGQYLLEENMSCVLPSSIFMYYQSSQRTSITVGSLQSVSTKWRSEPSHSLSSDQSEQCLSLRYTPTHSLTNYYSLHVWSEWEGAGMAQPLAWSAGQKVMPLANGKRQGVSGPATRAKVCSTADRHVSWTKS
jgi:hypothetical protein